MRSLVLGFLAIVGLMGQGALMPQAALAQTEVDLELILLADATGSIDDDEIRFQRQGYAEAIVDPAVLSAITGNMIGRIAVAYAEWAGPGSQDMVVDWTIIDGPDSAAAFAAALTEGRPRQAYGRNAIGSALLYGKAQLETNAFQGMRKVIDLSADSAGNWGGPAITVARDEVVKAGIIINGLAVLCRSCSGRPSSYDLEAAFGELIIGGPGSFVVSAENAQSFAAAVRRKLILEIAGDVPAGRLARVTGPDRAAGLTPPVR
ncbi:DUF1194 domain-containing protein [Pannonibacter tanglangensis]|nr:DUF1194 domain-containing protein [Pannonibacter sp. XCT-34]